MWRIALLFCLICSLTLNVYLFLQIEVQTIEGKIMPKSSAFIASKPQHHVIPAIKSKPNAQSIGGSALAIKQNDSSTSDMLHLDEIKKAIEEKDYISASFLSNSLIIYQRSDNASEAEISAQLSEIKKYWFHATKKLIEQALFIDAESSINAYLEFQRDDVDFLYQQVNLFVQQQLIELAIKHAYDVQYHVFDEVKKSKAILYARSLVQQQADILRKNTLWIELRELVEQVIILDPDDINLHWLFVRAQYELGEFEDALNAIEPLLEQPNYKVKAKALLVQIELALKKPESISLKRQGEHFIVEASINNNVDVSLMLDTGASLSLLSEAAFDTLTRYSDANYIKDIQMTTAGGVVVASLYQVDEVAIQGYVVKDFVFAVSSFSSERNDGLLGMNFLKNFDFHIDQTNSALILKNK